MKKNLWDNTSLQQDIKWDNQELPGVPDEVLLTKKWYMSRDSSKLVSKDDWKENHKKGIKKRSKDWHDNVAKANKEKYKDAEYLKQHQDRMAKRTASKDWQDKVAANNAKKRKRVQTPDGVFESRVAAAKHYNVWPGRIGVFIKTRPDEFYYLD